MCSVFYYKLLKKELYIKNEICPKFMQPLKNISDTNIKQ